MKLSADDKLAILDVLSRSAYAYDERKLDLLEACFTTHASFSIRITGVEDLIGPFEGTEAIMGLYRGSLEAQTDVRRHVVSNAFFESEAAEPVVISNLTLFATENGEARLLCTGVYRDQMKSTEAGWCIHRRHLDLDSPY
ncbi:MAG: nuclear transport factor 2 family protein [Congregibacter sp.]|nr:nuclear transport factor 2 family protein [Congregibacter sp.]